MIDEITNTLAAQFESADFNLRILNNKNMLNEYAANLVVSEFSWETDSDRVMMSSYCNEYNLLFNCCIAFIHTPALDYMIPVTIVKANLLGEPVLVHPLPFTSQALGVKENIVDAYIDRDFNSDEFVIIWNSLARWKPLQTLNYLIDELALIISVQQQLIEKCKSPYVIKTSDKELINDKIKAYNIMYKNIIYTDDVSNIESLDLNVDVSKIEELEKLRDARFRQLHGLLGVAYDSDLKKERVVVDEVHKALQVVELMAESKRKARQMACEEIKRRFNVVITANQTLTTLQHKEETKTENKEEESEGLL